MPMTRLLACLVLISIAATPAHAQVELLERVQRLESQVRALTGEVERLQNSNRQLEQQLRRFQEDVDLRLNERPAGGGARPPAQPARPQGGGQRGDAFDPNAQPGVAGEPRPLGTTPPTPPRAAGGGPVGAPGGANAPGPLDLGTLSQNALNDPNLAPPPREPATPREPGAPPPVAAATAADDYRAAYALIESRNWAQAEQGFRQYLQRWPRDRQADARFWLGEALFQRRQFREAAEEFLTVSTRFEQSGRAPNALLRLGQSLAALNEREAACATLSEVGRKYPNASASVKRQVDQEIQRVRCAS
jgi:tol-pal system protein YbgF